MPEPSATDGSTPAGAPEHSSAPCTRRKRSPALGGRRAVAFSMALLSVCVVCTPISPFLALAIALYFVMGSARGVGGVAMNTSLMEMVPKHLMGRVQNAFYFFGTFLQLVLALAVGAVAHNVSLVAAFAILACVYGLSFVASSWPVETVPEEVAGD